jgi:Tol biopolymer transport system component
MRLPLTGGAPQTILAAKINNFDCPRRPGTPCIMSEGITDKQVALFALDPVSGTSHEIFRVPRPMSNLNWTVSPDGLRLAMTGTNSQGRIEIRSLAGQIEKSIEVPGWSNPSCIDWAADGKAVFVSNNGLIRSPSAPIGATLLRVDLQGHAQPLWETRGGGYTWGIASPDNKYLAIREPATERNAWMIENF